MSSQAPVCPVRGKPVPRDPSFFLSETIARVPCRSLRLPFCVGPANRVGQRMTLVPLRQTHIHLESPRLISSISCLSRLFLRFHLGRIPSRSFARVWTLLKALRADPPPPLKHYARPSPKLLKLSVPCFPPTLVRLGSLCLLCPWALQEHHSTPLTQEGNRGGVSRILRSNVLRLCTLDKQRPTQTGS